jgi:SAM-dependent methyltransferase
MNRKERRAEERRAARQTLAGAAVPSQAAISDELFTQAMALDRGGNPAAAQKILRGILGRDPKHVASLVLSGDIAQREGRNQAAIKALRQALALDPDNVSAHDSMAMACQTLGRQDEAIDHFTQAITLGLGGVEDLLKRNPVVAGPLSRLAASWPGQWGLTELFGAAGTASLADDALLLALLRSKAVCDIEIERFLTAVRRGLLQWLDAGGNPTPKELEVLCALAQQCFINEYVFALTDPERMQSTQARTRLVAAIKAGEDIPPALVAITACYVPLHAIPRAGALLDRSWPPALMRLLIQQVREPLEEATDRSSIPVLTTVDDAVSVKVQAQYEENPYPRWTALARPRPETIDSYLREQLRLRSWPGTRIDRAEILIAGCGTGAHSIETAQRFPQSRVLAVDISLASLAYARRKTREAGLSNIEYGQADILKLGSLGRSFDVIEAVGVLHHLADPAAGWRMLLSLLRPGGLMLVGLYSALARRPVNAVRAFIVERGYRPTADGIRACRQEMVQRALGVISADFFTTSRCRDLYFHPMEHQFSIADIKSFLNAHGLTFLGFELPAEVLPQAEQQIPASAWQNLDRWEAFEQGHPRSFAGMYVFWVQQGAATEGPEKNEQGQSPARNS